MIGVNTKTKIKRQISKKYQATCKFHKGIVEVIEPPKCADDEFGVEKEIDTKEFRIILNSTKDNTSTQNSINLSDSKNNDCKEGGGPEITINCSQDALSTKSSCNIFN